MSDHPVVAYKILTESQMAELLTSGSFAGAPIDIADGYIHLSTAQQVDETVARHFAGNHDLHIAAVNLTLLGDTVCWELSRGGQLFPHVYAALPLSVVIAQGRLDHTADGAIILPDARASRAKVGPGFSRKAMR